MILIIKFLNPVYVSTQYIFLTIKNIKFIEYIKRLNSMFFMSYMHFMVKFLTSIEHLPLNPVERKFKLVLSMYLFLIKLYYEKTNHFKNYNRKIRNGE